jgi:hypothetical protein
MIADRVTELVHDLTEDMDQAAAKLTWLKRLAASDGSALGEARNSMLALAAKAAAVAADAASISAQIEDAEDGVSRSKRPNRDLANNQKQ